MERIFDEYCTDIVVAKLSPASNSQRNEALNSVIGSKNPKIRYYGGSESNDFRVACGIGVDKSTVSLGSLRIDDYRTTAPLGRLIVQRRRPVEI